MSATVELEIKNHCVQTAARKEYGRLMETYFNTDDPEGMLEEKIELLREFIENSDFPKLRSSDSRLSGEVEAKVLLSKDARGDIKLTIC